MLSKCQNLHLGSPALTSPNFLNICATLSHVSSVSVKLIKSYELKLIKSREIINQVYLEQDVHLAEMPGRVKCQGNPKL